jgi:hypothetical protein
MADNTGAPWLLPYPESTDLVRDGASDIEALATAVASGLTAANTGIGTNVVQTVKSDVFTLASATFTDITGLTATITPSTDTSKVLVIVSVAFSGDGVNTGGHARLMRAGTPIYIGDAAGSRTRATSGFQQVNDSQGAQSWTFLDSPASDAAVTYNVQLRRTSGSGLALVNRITLVEVAP